mmetsp:Transcript_59/g.103  ORF Transcript_59/g.103 Transcript_59/m.103 type:complete len:145 (-) Transcript_59:81-515(-)
MPLCTDVFHQRGGRCKVLEEDETEQCSAERLAGWKCKQEQERSRRHQQIQVQQSNLQKAKSEVSEFLHRRGIRSDSFDVNVAKNSCWGLCRTYPLHLAARERDWHMVRLLLFFGADPAQRDSLGRTPYDFMGPLIRAEEEGFDR